MECSAHNISGDQNAGINRVAGGAIPGAVLGAAAGLAIAGATANPVVLGLGAGVAGGAALGVAWMQVYDWFTRLKEVYPDPITIVGTPHCAGKNHFGIQPFTDGDWTTNIGKPPLKLVFPTDLPLSPGVTDPMDEIRTRAAWDSNLPKAALSFQDSACSPTNPAACVTPILHCEISSHIGSASVVGGAIGTTAGVIGGCIAAAIICAALGAFTFGIGALLCLLIAAIVVAALAVAGYFIGAFVGSVVGAIQDAVSDFDKQGQFLESHQQCVYKVSGRWVTDTSHGHNEIHDITSIVLVDCGVGSAAAALTLTAAVGTGRHPSGVDP
ncbi:MAG: hypothetical protein JO083_05645 [Candidatus Eremiobacteraeota bacterium]|nr:hypothetical protein [Candidatus Eremiobacteraeota bacterium]